MNRRSFRNRFGLLVVAGAMGVGTPMLAPSIVRAADDDPKAVAEARVPPAVSSTARSTYLDARDVVYRKDGKQYDVNFTTPTNVRLQVTLNEDGTIARDVHLAPNQPKDAPKKDERERIATQWAQRAAQVRATPVAPPPIPVTPVPPAPVTPGAPPPVVGDLPQIPVQPVNTPIGASELPAAVLQSFDRFTAGGKDIRYYRQASGTTTVVRYMADYTANDGSRREVVVADNGSLLAGPLVLRDTVEDKDLLADRPDNQQIPQPAQTQRLEARDLPPRALATMNKYTERASDIRYRRDTYPDRSVGYTVHWVLNDNGRRYWITTKEDGSLIIPPRLSSIQPGSTNDPEGVRSVAVRWADVPDRVKQTMEPLTRRDRDASYFKQVRDGNKVTYGAQYSENGRKMWVRVDESGKTVAGPVAADTGRPVGDAGREPVPAAGRVPPGTPVTPGPAAKGGLSLADLPQPVQQYITTHTKGGRNVVATHHTEGGRPVYRVVWEGADGDRHQVRLHENGKVVGANPGK